VIEDKHCDIMMSILTESPFNLVLGDLVVSRVTAINEKGQGEYSEINTDGALIYVLPLSPSDAPTRGEETNESQIEVDWVFLTTYLERGGSTIDSYEL
jgi:hypothetical protein